VFLGRNDNGL